MVVEMMLVVVQAVAVTVTRGLVCGCHCSSGAGCGCNCSSGAGCGCSGGGGGQAGNGCEGQ